MHFQLYDLYTSFNHPGVNHANGCPAEESACSSISSRKCGEFGVCQMVTLGQSEVECVCKPGYRPSRSGSSNCDTGLALIIGVGGVSPPLPYTHTHAFFQTRHYFKTYILELILEQTAHIPVDSCNKIQS